MNYEDEEYLYEENEPKTIELPEVSGFAAFCTIASLIIIAAYIIYVPVLKTTRDDTLSFIVDLGASLRTGELLSFLIHWFPPVILPLIWGIVEKSKFEFLGRGPSYSVYGTSVWVLVFWGFKFLAGFFVLYLTGAVAILVYTAKSVKAAICSLIQKHRNNKLAQQEPAKQY